jgi:uncharacterized protein YdhG (YjbR/CyaY superfamily)
MDAKDRIVYMDVDNYLAHQPELVKPFLVKMRQTIRKAAPEAEEGMSYGMPSYKLHGILVYFAAFKNHYSLFALPKAIVQFRDRLKEYKTSKGTIQFGYNKPVPVKLISEIVKLRVQENLDKEEARKHKNALSRKKEPKP